MTRAELNAIRARVEADPKLDDVTTYPNGTTETIAQESDRRRLLAEVDRLQADVNLYLPIVANAELLKAGYQRETERLRKLLADAGESARKARVENKFLRERNRRDEAVSLLAEQEWITDGRECLVYCIHCGQPESKGHDEYCRAFGREGIVTGCLEEKAELTARFEALMDEIDEAVTR